MYIATTPNGFRRIALMPYTIKLYYKDATRGKLAWNASRELYKLVYLTK